MSSEIRCPFCKVQRESKTLSTRPGRFGTIRRRRECCYCKERFTTIESTEALPVYRAKFDSAKSVTKTG